MSDNDGNDNVFDLFGDDGGSDEDVEASDSEGNLEADPGLVAFMDQQAAEFNAQAEHAFADRYGFVHNCKCDEDYAKGNMVSVTECYGNMTLEALDACATLHAENKMLRSLITMAVGKGVNDDTGSIKNNLDPEVYGEPDSGNTGGNISDDYDAFA